MPIACISIAIVAQWLNLTGSKDGSVVFKFSKTSRIMNRSGVQCISTRTIEEKTLT